MFNFLFFLIAFGFNLLGSEFGLTEKEKKEIDTRLEQAKKTREEIINEGKELLYTLEQIFRKDIYRAIGMNDLFKMKIALYSLGDLHIAFRYQNEQINTTLRLAIIRGTLDIIIGLIDLGATIHHIGKIIDISIELEGDHEKAVNKIYEYNIGDTEISIAARALQLKILQMFIEKRYPWGNEQTNSLCQLNVSMWDFEDRKNNPVFTTLYQLFLFDSEKASQYKFIEYDSIEGQHISNILDLFRIVKEGSYKSGNIKLIKKFKKYIGLGLVDKNHDTLFDIAVKNGDKIMVMALLLEDNNIIDHKDWKKESAIQKLILCNRPSILHYLIALGYALKTT